MSQNRSERLESCIDSYGGKATLAVLLKELREDGGLVYKLTAAISELRSELKLRPRPMTINCYRGKTPSENVYAKEPLLELFTKVDE